jgi:hypothetical protein
MFVIKLHRSGACRTLRSACLFLCLAVLVALQTTASAAEGYLAELQRQAREQGLASDRTWEVLLHYKPAGKGVKSLVDDPRFFNAPDGKRNPEAELFATLASFFTGTVKEGAEHPQCQFVARYTWLNGQLGFDPSRLPRAACPAFEKALNDVNPRSLVLVYPNTLLNSPSSMFGHTFVRINSTSESDLLSHAASYAAITGDNPGALYPIKGLLGFFKGRYSNLPYYEKVKEYTDIEQRDIWEYHLNLSPDEAYKTFLHVWEMKDFYSDYYFFDENCSFELLFLIEAGRPSLRLTDEFSGWRFWVIPVDTVRAAQKLGLVERVTYRPSRATKMLRIASGMDAALRDMTFAVAEGKLPPKDVLDRALPTVQKREVLDLSTELTQYRFSSGRLDQEIYKAQFLDILSARSTLGTPGEDPYPIATPTPPDQGHLSARVRAGGGYRTGSWFTELEWRAAYHDLTDIDEGYVRGAQINFMDLSFRYYFAEEELRLHRLRVVDIVSLAPWNDIFKPISWKVNAGAEEILLDDGRDHPVLRLNAGGGLAGSLGVAGIAYLLPEADLQASTRLDNDYALGFGGTVGLMANPAKDWKVNIWSQGLFYRAGDEHQSITAALQQTLRFSTNFSISLDAVRERSYGNYKTDVVLRGNWYY